MKFLSPEVALYLYKSTIHTCMEYCYVWAGAPSCYLELLDKLQKQIYWTVGPSLAASLEPFAHHQNVACLSLFFIGITLKDVLQDWLKRFHFFFLGEVYWLFWYIAWFFYHHSLMLQGCLCQQFLSSHS